ncbi:hypothetical protein B0T37_21815 [Chromobacterium violaceum]|uniref:hypothetical protein n=1 Tax=Chromobacterium violaceum TaxID=536 RepID=UPI0009D932F1|nr:hypothetical protein [Chromobacterium violaceum]OQS08093.1 hypothetical protein B0T38_21825 [Chromobacterium violaceum]OQS20213.1 hypothetical protein B0T37_21815 [Chromobacterium violaceum]
MNVGWIDAERQGRARSPDRDLLEEQSGRQWQRQLDAELANHSVCRAIPLGDGECVASTSIPEDGAGAQLPEAQGDLTPFSLARRTQAAEGGAKALPGQALAMDVQPAAARGTPAAAHGWSIAPAELAQRGGESAPAARAALASDAETVLRSWLKPCKITVFADQGQLRVWVRDARMNAGEAEALGQRLERHIREKGGRLAMLAVNGAVVFSDAAAGLNVLKQR